MSDETGGNRSIVVSLGICATVVLTLSTSTITTPLWLDSISGNHDSSDNATNITCITNQTCNSTTSSSYHRLDNYTVVFIVNFIYLVISGLLLFILTFCVRGKITDASRKYPKSEFALIGFSDAVSSIFFVYAADGSRTAPYLQSLVMNFAIPVTFIVRFIILRKRPTAWKAIFAGLVLCAEFIALLPSIFPSLEKNSSRKDDGGASGVAGILWPLCYFIGFLPQAVVNVILEKSSKTRVAISVGTSQNNTLHPVYLLFWTYLFCFIGVTLLFWTDIIPGFGNTSTIKEFWNIFTFNIECFIGAAECPSRVHIFSTICIVAMLANRFFTILFLKIMEGANYLIIVMSIQVPLVLLFWTLFDENPFQWHPHLHLSTWLSFVAIAIMLPAVFFYSRQSESNSSGIPSTSIQSRSRRYGDEQTRPFYYSTDSYQSIDATSTLLGPDFFSQNRDFEPIEPYYLESSINDSDNV